MDDEIRRFAQHTLAEKYPHLNISVGGARFVEGHGIAVYDLTISETSPTRLQDNLLMVDEMLLECDVRLGELFHGPPVIHRIIVKRPQLLISKKIDGKWNLESLWPPPDCGPVRPRVEIQDAQIAFSDESQPKFAPLVVRDGNFIIFTTKTSKSPEIIKISGTLGGPTVKSTQIEALFDPLQQTVQIAGKVAKLQLSPELIAWAATFTGSHVGPTVSEGIVDGEFNIQHQFTGGRAPHVEARLFLSDGRLEDPRLPRPVTEISGEAVCQGSNLKIRAMHGNCGTASLALTLEKSGWNRTAPLALAMRVENISLDKKLYHALPELLRIQWDKYQPTGIVDAEFQLTFDGQRWRPKATLRGRELAFESDKFRYRLNNGSGALHYSLPNNQDVAELDIDLVGYGGGQPLRIVGQVFDPAPGATGWIEISGQDVEIEKRMIAALPDKTREVIQSLHPEGRFNLHWRLERTQKGQTKPHKSLRLELVETRINYEKFPYPLSHIHGLILAEDDRWKFRDLVSGGTRSVYCQGYLVPTPNGRELSLQFTGQQVPMDDELKQALPPAVSEAWDELRPRGQIDLTADIQHLTGFTKPSIRVVVRPRPESATIEPTFFPYLLEKIEGNLSYQDGRLLMSGMRARHGHRTTIRTNGHGTFSPDGAWEVQLDGLAADRLAVRRDLTYALPMKMQKLIDQLKPTGSFELSNSSLQFSKSAESTAQVRSEWDLQLNCHQTDLQVGIDLRNVHGTVRLMGESQGSRCHSAGEMRIDTATFKDVQFTDIRGPLWVDETSCLLGRWACEKRGEPARRVTAKVYDGNIVANAWVTFDGLPNYGAEASLVGADLLRIMAERFQGQQDFQGKVAANLSLRGRGRQLDNMVGQGDVKITEADIYELPLLVGLLKVLRNSTPDSTAFNQSDMKFRIQGRHIYLDQLDFLGDAVSLFGKGYTNFDQQLNLTFYGIVGRNEIRIPLLKNFVNQVGQSTMQMYVDGTLADPQIHTQAFPMVNQLIQQIQTDLDAVNTGVGERQAQRSSPFPPAAPKTQ